MAVHKKKKLSLKSGRPPPSEALSSRKSLSAKATQNTIVSFHQLNKALAKARSSNDTVLSKDFESQIQKLGGLKAYQAASIQGQSSERGGDSSIVLMKWLEDEGVRGELKGRERERKFRLLEVGALSTRNACTRSGCFEMERIDLESREKGILKQDFMEREVPREGEGEGWFDVISLSLVLNFVPSAEGRGEMLRRTTEFLRRRTEEVGQKLREVVSATLFLVLPASCVLNSRYFDDDRLSRVMKALGYVLLKRKTSKKLVYSLWQLREEAVPKQKETIGKTKVRDGPGMNNFYIELKVPG